MYPVIAGSASYTRAAEEQANPNNHVFASRKLTWRPVLPDGSKLPCFADKAPPLTGGPQVLAHLGARALSADNSTIVSDIFGLGFAYAL